MITNKGYARGIKGTRLFLVSSKNKLIQLSDKYILKVEPSSKYIFIKNLLTSSDHVKNCQRSITSLDNKFVNSLNDGDVISVSDDGTVNVLWKCKSKENLLFLTDYCNSRCIMCPQTQTEQNKHYYNLSQELLKLVKEKPDYLCLTGGEPTFLKSEYIKILSCIKDKMPNVALQVLTNGKNFSDFDFAKQSVLNAPVNTLYAIPIYSGNSKLHDNIVCSNGSFTKTVKGILNLYKLKQNIELRIVITKQNYKDLPNIAHFIYWNMPFVYRIAFMGMETHGNAANNLDLVWIEPKEYTFYLNEAVQFLNNRMLDVLIYNLPHCILPSELRSFAKDSISDWKKNFLPECDGCSKQQVCSGVFTTSVNTISGINKIY